MHTEIGLWGVGIIMPSVDSCINGSLRFSNLKFCWGFEWVLQLSSVKHSWIWFLVSSNPTRIFTSIIMKSHRFDYSAVVFFRAHHYQIKSWIPAATSERNYIFHQPDRLNTVIEVLTFICSAAAWAIKLPVATIVCHWLMMSSMCVTKMSVALLTNIRRKNWVCNVPWR